MQQRYSVTWGTADPLDDSSDPSSTRISMNSEKFRELEVHWIRIHGADRDRQYHAFPACNWRIHMMWSRFASADFSGCDRRIREFLRSRIHQWGVMRAMQSGCRPSRIKISPRKNLQGYFGQKQIHYRAVEPVLVSRGWKSFGSALSHIWATW